MLQLLHLQSSAPVLLIVAWFDSHSLFWTNVNLESYSRHVRRSRSPC